MTENYQLKEFFEMHWLRPETALWNTVASKIIADEIASAKNLYEVGIGNGTFTFMTLGGTFDPNFDWYLNVNTEGFLKGADIYDSDVGIDIASYVTKKPKNRLLYAMDHKKNLVTQVERLDFVDNLFVADGNKEFAKEGVDTIFSNILYWLNSPIHPLKEFDKMMKPGSKAVIVFPNKRYHEYCFSYDKTKPLWHMMNRGRCDTMHWSMEVDELDALLNEHTDLKVASHKHYLSKVTLQCWDIGLRMISPQLIKMSNMLSKEDRLEIKNDWVTSNIHLLENLLEHEVNHGPKEGGYTLAVLEK